MKAQNRRRRKRKIIYERPPSEPFGMRVIDMQSEKAARERAAFDETKARRMIQHEVDEHFAKTQECGHSIGRLARQLKWNNETAARRIAAGFRFAEVVCEYNKDVLGAPNPNPPAMDMNRIGGKSTRDVTQERIKSLTNDYMRLIGALDMVGPRQHLFNVMRIACVEDAGCENWGDKQVVDLVKALDAVAAGC